MTQRALPKDPVSKPRRVLAGFLLAAVLVQIGMFFIGLLVPVGRIIALWGKSLEDRQMVVCQPARVLTQLADQFPVDAKIYLTDPQLLIHWNSIYFFYPRVVTATMTDRKYGSREAYTNWNERPTEDWLISNKFTAVFNCKNGLRIKMLQPVTHPTDDASR